MTTWQGLMAADGIWRYPPFALRPVPHRPAAGRGLAVHRQVLQTQQPQVEQCGQHLHLHLGGLSPPERAEAMRQLRGGQ